MDKVTLHPDGGSYSYTDGIEVLRAILDGGVGRYGPGVLNAAIPLGVQWTCDEAEYEYLRGVYRQHVDEGHAPFQIDLFIDSIAYVEHYVRIMPGTFGLASHSGLSYVVTASLEVQPTPKLPSSAPLAKLTLPPDKSGYSFTDTAEAVHQALDGGLGRVRRSLIGVSTILNIQWTTGVEGFLYLRDFYRAWVLNPKDGFKMDLLIDNVILDEFSCQFVPGSMRLTGVHGHTITVSCQIEAFDGEWPNGIGTPKQGCDCSHIAWMTGFEYVTGNMMDVGQGVLEYYADGEGDGRIPALWQTASLLLGYDSADVMTFTDPAVDITEDWTVRFSMLAPLNAYQVSDAYLFRMFDAENNVIASLLVDHDDANGGFKFWVTVSGSTFLTASVPYATLLNIELSAEAATGIIRFFANGEQLLNETGVYTGGTAITEMVWLRPGYNYNAEATWFDEIRVQNIIEHTEPHTVTDLPFCRCDHEPWFRATFDGGEGQPISDVPPQFPLDGVPWTDGTGGYPAGAEDVILNGAGGCHALGVATTQVKNDFNPTNTISDFFFEIVVNGDAALIGSFTDIQFYCVNAAFKGVQIALAWADNFTVGVYAASASETQNNGGGYIDSGLVADDEEHTLRIEVTNGRKTAKFLMDGNVIANYSLSDAMPQPTKVGFTVYSEKVTILKIEGDAL